MSMSEKELWWDTFHYLMDNPDEYEHEIYELVEDIWCKIEQLTTELEEKDDQT